MADESSDFLSLVRRELGAWLEPEDTSKEARLLRRWDRKRRALARHTRKYVVVNGFLALLWLSLAVLVGARFPWFVFPLLGWGMGYTMHVLSFRAWTKEHRSELEAARQKLGLTPPPAGESSWDRLESRCREAVAAAHAALDAAQGGLDDARLRAQLREGERQLTALLRGARDIEQTLGEVAPGGVAAIDRELADVERRETEAREPRSRDIERKRQTLLASRRDKIEALQREQTRIEGSVEGFLLAAENLRLDALRLSNEPAERSELEQAVDGLQEELDVLEKVHRELLDP